VGGNSGHTSALLATMQWNNDLDHIFSLNGTPTSERVADRGSPCSRATCTTSAARTLVWRSSGWGARRTGARGRAQWMLVQHG
jgi:hypothetical protein